MAAELRSVALAVAVSLAFATAAASAQQLQRLHVQTFTLTSDAAHPQLEQPFHVTITIRVSEGVSAMKNVYLPAFAGPENLGDERQLLSGSSGTLYRETLTLVAHDAGPLAIGSAYLDAVDARDGKPKRFISNELHLRVGEAATPGRWGAAARFASGLFQSLLVVAAVVALGLLFWRKPRSAIAEDRPIPRQLPIPARDPVADAFSQLLARRDRAAVLDLRRALWRKEGAGKGETLDDLLRRGAGRGPAARRMLFAVERAAFTQDAHLGKAIDDVLTEAPKIVV